MCLVSALPLGQAQVSSLQHTAQTVQNSQQEGRTGCVNRRNRAQAETWPLASDVTVDSHPLSGPQLPQLNCGSNSASWEAVCVKSAMAAKLLIKDNSRQPVTSCAVPSPALLG